MIGIFDSGVGGITVAKAIETFCPQSPLIYFGDIAHSPYGSKSPEIIMDYSRRNIDFLVKQGATAVVIACNTAAAVASEALRREYSVPIFDVVTATVERAAASTVNKKIGVIGTRATVRSKVYEQRIHAIKPDCRIVSQACPLLVSLIEENWLTKRETKMILRRYLYPLRLLQLDTLILGCTHYPLLSKLIQQRIGRKVRLIDSSREAALHLKAFLDRSPNIASGRASSNNQNKDEKQKTSPFSSHHPSSRFFVSD
ncbi:MAG: glutamate racemase, partial [Tenericutes bacterium]